VGEYISKGARAAARKCPDTGYSDGALRNRTQNNPSLRHHEAPQSMGPDQNGAIPHAEHGQDTRAGAQQPTDQRKHELAEDSWYLRRVQPSQQASNRHLRQTAMIYTNYRCVRTRFCLQPCSDPAPPCAQPRHADSTAMRLCRARSTTGAAAGGPDRCPAPEISAADGKAAALPKLPRARTPAGGHCMPHHLPNASAGLRTRCGRREDTTAWWAPGRCCQT